MYVCVYACAYIVLTVILAILIIFVLKNIFFHRKIFGKKKNFFDAIFVSNMSDVSNILQTIGQYNVHWKNGQEPQYYPGSLLISCHSYPLHYQVSSTPVT